MLRGPQSLHCSLLGQECFQRASAQPDLRWAKIALLLQGPPLMSLSCMKMPVVISADCLQGGGGYPGYPGYGGYGAADGGYGGYGTDPYSAYAAFGGYDAALQVSSMQAYLRVVQGL